MRQRINSNKSGEEGKNKSVSYLKYEFIASRKSSTMYDIVLLGII